MREAIRRMEAAPASKSVDLSEWDRDANDHVKIQSGRVVPCRVCQEMFGRVRLTERFCSRCERAFCEGEHGAVALAGPFQFRGICVRCSDAASRPPVR